MRIIGMRWHFPGKLFQIIGMALIKLIFVFGFVSNVNAQGKSSEWTPPINFSQEPETYSYVPSMLCDRYQNLHVFWGERLDNNGGSQTAIYYRNNVDGKWSEPVDILIASIYLELSAAITPDDLVHLIWSDSYHQLMYTRSPLRTADQISQWAKPVSLADGTFFSNVYVDPHGTLYVIYTVPSSDYLSNTIYYIYSINSGETWSLPSTILGINTLVPSNVDAQLLVDGKGRFHVVYTVRSLTYGEYSALGYLRSEDTGGHWDFSLEFPSSETAPGVAQIAVYSFGEDEIHLTYDLPERMHQWSYDGGETWSEPIPIINGVSMGAAFGGYNQLVKDSSGLLHVVSAWAGGVYHATWDGNGWSMAELIDKPDFDPHGQMMTVCQGNKLSVIYTGNDDYSEIFYSEKILDLPGIPQTTIPYSPLCSFDSATPTVFAGVNEDNGSKPTLSPDSYNLTPPVLSGQSLWSPVILAAALVVILISAVLILTIRQR